MERQEDGQVHHRVAWLVSLVDQWCRPVWPGARWAGLPRLSPSAGAGPGAAQRRRLTLTNGLIRQQDVLGREYRRAGQDSIGRCPTLAARSA